MAEEKEWNCASDGQQRGPISREELRWPVAAGQISASSLVWSQGMATWVRVADVPEMVAGLPLPALCMPQPVQVGYYTPNPGIPQRAIENLRGYASPTGDTSDWPLDDQSLTQFQQTVKIRRRMTEARKLYRGLLLLTIVGGAISCLAVLINMLQGGGSGAQRVPALAALLEVLSLSVALALVFFFVLRGTARAQLWAPLTMFIISLAMVTAHVALTFLISEGAPANAAMVIGISFFGVVLEGIFAALSFRAFVAIPNYLAQPAWCQELIVKAGQ